MNIDILDDEINLLVLLFLTVAVASIGLVIWYAYVGIIPTEIASLVFSGVLAAITAGYAFLTFLLVRENRRDREQRVAPTLIVEDFRGQDSVKITNIGNGPAIDVTIDFVVQPEHPTESVDGIHIPAGDSVEVEHWKILSTDDDHIYELSEVEFSYISSLGKGYHVKRSPQSDIKLTGRLTF